MFLVSGRHLLHTSAQERMIYREALRIQAFYLAQGGMEWGIRRLEDDPDWRGDRWEWGEGQTQIEVSPIGSTAEIKVYTEKGEARQSLSASLVEKEGQWMVTAIW